VISVLPIAALALRASGGRGFERAGTWLGSSPWTSLGAAVFAATIIAAIAIVLGHALARESAFARLVDGTTLLAFFLPSAVLGVGLIATWNRGPTQIVYGTAAILVVGFVARYAVVGIRVVA